MASQWEFPDQGHLVPQEGQDSRQQDNRDRQQDSKDLDLHKIITPSGIISSGIIFSDVAVNPPS